MPDYKKMYYTLFNNVTEVIKMLQAAQQQTEEMYISGTDPEIKIATGEAGTSTDGADK